MSYTLTDQDYRNAAATLGASFAAVKAVATVESNGSGFLPDKRVKVQYEPHVMYQRLKKRFGLPRARYELAKYPKLVAVAAGSYQSLDQEDQDMNSAAQLIDRTCALESASWGAFQIMGYHWETCRFPSLQSFINKQYSAAGQLDTFVMFIKADSRLEKALKNLDWATFARIYNGPNYAKNRYDTKMADAYKSFGGA